MSRRMFPLALLALLGACNVAAQRPVEYPIYSVGTADPAVAGAWTVTLDVAQIGLGPIYFCVTQAASADLCPTALAELADVVAVDALAATPQPLGSIRGLTGELRSLSYDFGINWFTTQRTPTPAPLAPGGHAAHLEGQAVQGSTTLPFVADIDITPQNAGMQAVQGMRVDANITDSAVRLDVRLTPAQWLVGVDFDELLALSPGGGEPVAIGSGSRAHNVIATAMTTTGAPTFTWTKTGASARLLDVGAALPGGRPLSPPATRAD